MEIEVRTKEATSSGGGGGTKGSGGISPEKLKIIIVVALFAVTGVVVAWQLGLFAGSKRPTGSTLFETPEEEEKAWEDAQRERERVHPPERTPPPSGS